LSRSPSTRIKPSMAFVRLPSASYAACPAGPSNRFCVSACAASTFPIFKARRRGAAYASIESKASPVSFKPFTVSACSASRNFFRLFGGSSSQPSSNKMVCLDIICSPLIFLLGLLLLPLGLLIVPRLHHADAVQPLGSPVWHVQQHNFVR